jgi:uncharacterized cupredoxin-like copper-binding protein
MRRSLTLPFMAGALLLLAACGDDDTASSGNGGDATRTVEIDMVDIAFEPDTIQVDQGETVRFVFTNTGDVAHDAYIGDQAAQDEHEDEMREPDRDEHGGGHGEDDTGAVTVEPGDTGELTHTFDSTGTIEIGCHQEGHYAAGMKITVEVA